MIRCVLYTDQYGLIMATIVRRVVEVTAVKTVKGVIPVPHHLYVNKDPKMAPLKRHTCDAEFKLKAISHAVEHVNRAAAREFHINE